MDRRVKAKVVAHLAGDRVEVGKFAVSRVNARLQNRQTRLHVPVGAVLFNSQRREVRFDLVKVARNLGFELAFILGLDQYEPGDAIRERLKNNTDNTGRRSSALCSSRQKVRCNLVI